MQPAPPGISLMGNSRTGPGLNQRGWPRIRNRLFHLYFLARRPMTLGVRIAVHDRPSNSVLLVRHTYVPGFQLPGGGVEAGETMHQAMERELLEEANVASLQAPRLVSMHYNRSVSRRDHVALFVTEHYVRHGPKQPDREIAEAGFFRIDDLPAETTDATRRRIVELFHGGDTSPYW